MSVERAEERIRDNQEDGGVTELGFYLREIGEMPRLKSQEEIDLGRKVKAGREAETKLSREGLTAEERAEFSRQMFLGEEAKEKLIISNLRLVVWQAKKHQGRGLSFLDLVQEGNLGLIKAAQEYDPDKINPETGQPFRFSTYAIWWIRHEITLVIENQGRTIRVPTTVHQTQRKILQAEERLIQELGREPKPGEIAAQLKNATPESVEKTRAFFKPISSLDTPVFRRNGKQDKQGSELSEFVPDEGEDVDDIVTSNILEETVPELLGKISPREKRVLTLRFGLADDEQRTLVEVGKRLSLTKQRIHQIEKKALRKLRFFMNQI